MDPENRPAKAKPSVKPMHQCYMPRATPSDPWGVHGLASWRLRKESWENFQKTVSFLRQKGIYGKMVKQKLACRDCMTFKAEEKG